MKTIFITALFCLISVVSYSQITFKQGYLLVDNRVTVFDNMAYEMNISDSIVNLPHKSCKIDSTKLVNNILIMYLSDGDIAQFYQDQTTGGVFTVVWTNGRLVFWERPTKMFEINFKK